MLSDNFVRLPDKRSICLRSTISGKAALSTIYKLFACLPFRVTVLSVFVFKAVVVTGDPRYVLHVFCCVQFPAELQAEGTRRLPQRQAGASRQFVGGSPRQIYPRHDGETTDTESSLEREVSIVSKHLNAVTHG